MNALDELLSEERFSNDVPDLNQLEISLPKSENVKGPGRPKHVIRLSSLSKDYANSNAASRRNKLVHGKYIATKNSSKQAEAKVEEKVEEKKIINRQP